MRMNTKVNISDVTQDVRNLLAHDTSGHGMDHIERVLRLALEFAESEGADKDIVTLAALLHDVDDYKLFGKESADNLVNANRILNKYNIKAETKATVIDIIRNMGFNKYIDGIRPKALEGKIVSDADMCDAIGAIGILRTHEYSLSIGNKFFDKTLNPTDTHLEASEYRVARKGHSAQHFLDKLLKVPSILMTESGKKEGEKRKTIMNDFLRELFREEDAESWQDYLKVFEKENR